MFSGAAIAMATSTNFVVEGAVDFISFCPKDGGEVVGHIWR